MAHPQDTHNIEGSLGSIPGRDLVPQIGFIEWGWSGLSDCCPFDFRVWLGHKRVLDRCPRYSAILTRTFPDLSKVLKA